MNNQSYKNLTQDQLTWAMVNGHDVPFVIALFETFSEEPDEMIKGWCDDWDMTLAEEDTVWRRAFQIREEMTGKRLSFVPISVNFGEGTESQFYCRYFNISDDELYADIADYFGLSVEQVREMAHERVIKDRYGDFRTYGLFDTGNIKDNWTRSIPSKKFYPKYDQRYKDIELDLHQWTRNGNGNGKFDSNDDSVTVGSIFAAIFSRVGMLSHNFSHA